MNTSDDFNETTRRAIEEIRSGHGFHATSVEDLFRQCLEDDDESKEDT